MRFLISNDDGIHAPGLLALHEALAAIGEVVVIAPHAEQSGCASALHISQPLYTQQLPSGFIVVNGTPADCVFLGLQELCQHKRFDWVITGINSGANLGQDVMYSGTFGAALTAQLFGVPAMATSLVGGKITCDEQQIKHYKIAAAEIVNLVTESSILDTMQQLPYHVLNVNIPPVATASEIKGRKITRLGHHRIAKPVHHTVDPRGRDAYWLSLYKSDTPLATRDDAQNPNGRFISNNNSAHDNNSPYNSTDYQAISAGYISVSPVKLPHTPTSALDKLSALGL